MFSYFFPMVKTIFLPKWGPWSSGHLNTPLLTKYAVVQIDVKFGGRMIKFSILVWIFRIFSLFDQSLGGHVPPSLMICAQSAHGNMKLMILGLSSLNRYSRNHIIEAMFYYFRIETLAEPRAQRQLIQFYPRFDNDNPRPELPTTPCLQTWGSLDIVNAPLQLSPNVSNELLQNRQSMDRNLGRAQVNWVEVPLQMRGAAFRKYYGGTQ